MANAEFQDRLKRIQGTQAASPRTAPSASPGKRQKPSPMIVAAGGGLIGGAVHILRSLNANYASVKANMGMEFVLGLALVGAFLLLCGIAIMFRAFASAKAAPVEPAPESDRKSGGIWTMIGVIHGLVLGFLLILALQASAFEELSGKAIDPSYLSMAMLAAAVAMVTAIFHPIAGLFSGQNGFFKSFGFIIVGVILMGILAKLGLIVPFTAANGHAYIL